MIIKKTLAILPFILLAVLPQARAQQPPPIVIEISAFGGAVVPTGDVFEDDGTFAAALGDETVSAEHEVGPIFGGRIDIWLDRRFGVEGAFAYALSDVELQGTDLGQPLEASRDASVWYGALKALYRFDAGGSPLRIHVGGGPALVGHSGDFYEDVDGTTDVALVLAVGATWPVLDRVSLRLDVEDYLYSLRYQPDAIDVEPESKFQNELLFSGGLSVELSP